MTIIHRSLVRRSVPFVLLTCLFLTGCVEESVSGDESTFRFARWIPLAAAAAAIAATVGGVFLRSVSRYGWILLIGGPLFLIVVVPGLFMERVIVDDKHFDLQTGFWFAPTRHVVQFKDL